jgi:hypothetical protein
MADELYVLNEGVNLPNLDSDGDFTDVATFSLSLGQYGTDASTNPNIASNIADTESKQADGIISFYEIHDDEISSGTWAGGDFLFPTDYTTFADNVFETPGYRVSIDVGSASGLTMDFVNRDYYILIYADDIYRHHFAKITEQVQYEDSDSNFEQVYNYDFTPPLKENIAKGSKVVLFTGPTDSGARVEKVVALGYGLRSDPLVTEERHDRYVNVSRPTFYFTNGETKLDPSKKYHAIRKYTKMDGTGSVTSRAVFKTASVSSDMILDKSFFTQNGVIVDERENVDDNTPGSHGNTETWANHITKYNDRDNPSGVSNISTYISFIDSPTRNQTMSAPSGINIKKSITEGGNIFEAEYIDAERFFEKKINDNERVRVKEFVGSDNISDEPSFALPGVFNNHTVNQYKFTVTGLLEGQDLRALLKLHPATFEVLYLDGYYYTISAISAPADGTQEVTISDKRAVSASTYTTSATTQTVTDATGFRKRWGSVVSNMGVSHEIDTKITGTNRTFTHAAGSVNETVSRNDIQIEKAEADIYGLEYLVGGDNYGIRVEVDDGDSLNNFTRFKTIPESTFYSTGNLLDSVRTNLTYNKTLVDGKIELKETDTEAGVFKVKISGRDKLAELLSTPVNSNYVYSSDFIYSTQSPYSDTLTDTGYNISSINNNQITATATITSGIEFGDILFVKTSAGKSIPLGAVSSVSSAVISLFKDCHLSNLNVDSVTVNSDIYKGKNIFLSGKSLEHYNGLDSDGVRINGPTTLLGSLDKGIVFSSGQYFRHVAGAVVTADGLMSEVKSTNSNNGLSIENLVTTFITGSTGEHHDLPIGVEDTQKHLTLSSMVEFDILNSEQKDGQTTYNIGYISPLCLGRVSEISNSGQDKWLSGYSGSTDYTSGFYLINGQGLPNGGFIHLLNNELCGSSYGPVTFTGMVVDDGAVGTSPATQYSFRFNPSIWRYTNKTRGEYRQSLRSVGNYNKKRNEYHNDYYQGGNDFSFYLSAYKASGDSLYPHNENNDETLLHRTDQPTEMLGIRPVVGSRFWDVTRYPVWSSGHPTEKAVGRYLINDHLQDHYYLFERWDNRVGGLHFFLPGDIYPESHTNWNNIGSASTHDITNMSLIFKNEADKELEIAHNATPNTYWDGVSKHGNRKDNDYFKRNIISTKGARARFNIARLVELTFDTYFNEVDYEHYDVKKSSDSSATINALTVPTLKSMSSLTTAGQSDGVDQTGTTINTDSANTAANGDYIFKAETGTDLDPLYAIEFLGKVQSRTATSITFTTAIPEALADNSTLYRLTIPSPENMKVLKTGEYIFPITSSSNFDIPNNTIAVTTHSSKSLDAFGSSVNDEFIMKLPINVNNSDVYIADGILGNRFLTETQSGSPSDVIRYDLGENGGTSKHMDIIVMQAQRMSNSHADDNLPAMKDSLLETPNTLTISQITNDVKYGNATVFSNPDTINGIDGFMARNKKLNGAEEDYNSSNGYTRAVNILFKPIFTDWDDLLEDGNSEEWGDHLGGDEAVFVFNVENAGGTSYRNWIHYANNLTGYFLYDETNDRLHQIKSHKISKEEDNYLRHYIQIDNFVSGSLSTSLVPLRLSQDCFYDFSPTAISFNELTERYTKIPGLQKMHDGKVANASKTVEGSPIFEKNGVRSMYVCINIDKERSTDKFLVSRSKAGNALLDSFPFLFNTFYVTDGVNSFVSEGSFFGTSGAGYGTFCFDKMKL